MNPNLSSLAVKASIIIWVSCCFCRPGSHRIGFAADGLDTTAAAGHPGMMPPGCDSTLQGVNPYPVIGAIPLPAGFHRLPAEPGSFAAWLRAVALKKDRTVRLYDGTPKRDQESQYAVLDVSVGNTDLQQCADAVMRLRAEYLYSRGDRKGIEFRTSDGTRLNFADWAAGERWKTVRGQLVAYRLHPAAQSPNPDGRATVCGDRKCFLDYLQIVFTYCGTQTLEKQLDPVARTGRMQIGDVFIKGGSPGHAMLVVDMATDQGGRIRYLLAQGYMPAQDIHIIKNFGDMGLSPWYSANYDQAVYTPGWVFYAGQLRAWPIEK
jgi:hypothetical protein